MEIQTKQTETEQTIQNLNYNLFSDSAKLLHYFDQRIFFSVNIALSEWPTDSFF